MILQLQITTVYLEPKAFRTIQLPSNFTFEQLETMIHTAFDWFPLKSFIFQIEQSHGEQITDQYIGVDYENDFFVEPILDDSEEVLHEWFSNVGDRATYILADDDKLDLSVEVTKIIDSPTHRHYPVCIDGQGFIDKQSSSPIDFEELSEDLQLMSSMDDDFLDAILDDAMDPEWARLLQEADILKKLKPWQYFNSDEIFVIEEPLTKELFYVSILGAGGSDFGIAAYIGEEGRQTLEKILSNQFSDDSFFDMHCLTVSFVDRDELESFDYQLIKENNFSFRGKKNWIQFRSYIPGLLPWLPDFDETENLQFIIQQTIKIVEKRKNGWHYPLLPANTYMLRHYTPEKKQWEESIVEIHDIEEMPAEEIFIELSDLDIKRIQKKKKSPVNVELDLFYLPQAIQENPDERPFYPLVVASIETQTGTVIFHDILPIPKNVYSAQAAFTAFLQSIDFKPRTLHVTPTIANYIAPLAKKFGIILQVGKLKEIPLFKQSMQTMPML